MRRETIALAVPGFGVFLVRPIAAMRTMAFSIAILFGSAGITGQDALIARIKAEWKASEARFDTVRCVWNEDCTYMPGSVLFPQHPVITRLPAEIPRRDAMLQKGWPLEPVASTDTRLVVLKGNWMRNEEPILSLSPTDPEMVHRVTNKSSFDGERAITLTVDGDSGRLVKRHEASNPDFVSSTWAPLKAFVRPFSAMGLDSIEVLSVNEAEQTAVVRNKLLKELTVALRKGCSIVAARQLHPKTGRVLWEYELNVEQDARQNWIPADWVFRDLTQVSPQEVNVQRTATIESFEYGMSLTKVDFQLDMPSEVTVENTVNRSSYRMSPPQQRSKTWMPVGIFVLIVTGIVALIARKVRRKSN